MIGIILVALGILALIYQGFTYTKREDVLKIGDLKVTDNDTKHVPLPPIIGVVAIIAGGAMVYFDGRTVRA